MKKFVLTACVAALIVGVTACQTIRPTGTPSGKTPVVFVHGWSADETTWNAAVDHFKAAGYTAGDIDVLYYDTSLSAADASAKLATEVDYLKTYTGKAKVDIVSHSFGSMVTKYCIEKGACANKVSHWMSLAGADNGTSTSAICAPVQASCADMAGTTTTIKDLQAAWGQITTQNVKVEVQWSTNDGTIVPAENSKNPAPAVNVSVNSALGHLDIPKDATVLTETVNFFTR